MAGASRDQALSLLAAANNHGDLAVKLSSLKQAKDILLSIEPSSASELFPYLVELQSSPESLVRKSLVEVVEEIGLKTIEHSSVLLPLLLTLLKDGDSVVARQSIVSGTNFFCSVLEEMALQFHRCGKLERWLEELWSWVTKFKDAVFSIALEPGCVGTKILSLKFLETYVLLFTSDINDSERPVAEGSRQVFNISWLVGGHPVLDPYMLSSEANKTLGILLNLLGVAGSLPGSLTITVINCLASIGRKRPVHYVTILSALLDFDPNFETVKGCHAASISYSVRTAFLGFLRCTNPVIVESRDRLLRALRAMNAGDAADQVIRQVDKMIKNTERALRDARGKDDQLSSQLLVSGDLFKKRSIPLDNDVYSHDLASKRIRYGSEAYMTSPIQLNDFRQDEGSVNGLLTDFPLLDGELTPVEKMIAMIGALLAEGERGAESLEILISKIQPDLLADIVITNMKHLPKLPPPLARVGNLPVSRKISSLNGQAQIVVGPPTNSLHSPTLPSQGPFSSSAIMSSVVCDTPSVNNPPIDSKRDPRRDPRRLDPRRVAVPVGLPSTPTVEDSNTTLYEFDGPISLGKPNSIPVTVTVDNPSAPLILKMKNDENLESPIVSGTGQPTPDEEVQEGPVEIAPTLQFNDSADPTNSPTHTVDEDTVAINLSDDAVKEEADASSFLEFDHHSPVHSNTSASEDTCQDLPLLPTYIELTQEQQGCVRKLAIERIIESYKHLVVTDCSQMRLALLARLVAQIDANDDVVTMLQNHIVTDYHEQKGHELVLHVLYHLHTLTISESVQNTHPALVYEKFLLAVAKLLLDSFPASEKSFSKLLGEVPILPDSILKLLDDLCYSDVTDKHGKDIRDVERVTQGLGAVWSLILGRPQYRQACLDIALKCAVHSQDEIRAKAIRLVANKLFQLSYISDNIEQFATHMLQSVDSHASDGEHFQCGSTEERSEGVVGSQEPSVSGSQISDSGISENNSPRLAHPGAQRTTTMSLLEVQRAISLYFALCTKKPSLLQHVFNIYGQAAKTVKQAFHRHIPILIRALGSSCPELLHIISDPPQGSENLLALVLQILTQETTPSSDLIATVKHLYETKLKDVSILIPMLSSLSKNEVLPIFPRLVALSIEKFQMALAHILQGSAHTGPALTPVEVLVAIHGIIPERDGLPLKKITDTCSACFEQRTVFTQQVLAKALSQMVDKTPLPLLFMRTVIQAIDAFPSLVDFVMEILSKLVKKQVWKLPKLWVGFLKCVSQTQPHSFRVLLLLPPPQLENALSKHPNLRNPLAAFASQPSVKTSLPRSILSVLGLTNEMQTQQSHLSSFHPSDTGSSVHGATQT